MNRRTGWGASVLAAGRLAAVDVRENAGVPPLTSLSIHTRAEAVREQIRRAAERVGASADGVILVAVTKTHPTATIVDAVGAGLTVLGENRVQEAAAKIPAVVEAVGAGAAAWHLIGHLQTNKAKDAARLFQVVQSVDSVRVAQALDRSVVGGRPLDVLIEVYVGDDPARPGLRPAELSEAAGQIVQLAGLRVRGLMTVAPLGWDERATRAAFAQVRNLRDRLAVEYPRVHWGELSMGMTDDFELAIEEGSTMVRIGRALFGPRGAR